MKFYHLMKKKFESKKNALFLSGQSANLVYLNVILPEWPRKISSGQHEAY